jgi:hypothetical protein
LKLELRHAKAAQSSNLKDDATHHDTEVLAAVALSSEHGAQLLRLKYANDATSYNRFRDDWRRTIRVRAIVEAWPKHVKDENVADAALRYWLNDICPACTGKGHPTIKYTPHLDEAKCDICAGTGKRPLECDGNYKRFIEGAIDTLERMTIQAAGVAMAKLAGDMEL